MRPPRGPGWLPALLPFLAGLPTAAAHGGLGGGPLEARFQLPPWVAWTTGALVVALSYLIVATYLTRDDRRVARAPAPHTRPDPPASWPRHLGRGAGLLLLAAVIVHAFQPDRASLLPPVVVWILYAALVPLLAYTVANPWPWVSPFRALAPVTRRLRARRRPLPWPRGASVPALLLLIGFVAAERLLGDAAAAPTLGLVLLGYTALTLVGMTLFGEEAWLHRGEVFDRLARHWAALTPWRRPEAASGLVALRHGDPAGVGFIVAIVFAVNFDGFLATPWGAAALGRLSAIQGPVAAVLLLVVVGFLIFLAAYHAAVASIRRAARSLEPHAVLAARFAPTLLPIAAGYHAAHNVFLLVENAPLLVHALDDPFGRGWALLGDPHLPAAWTPPPSWGVGLGLAQMLLIVAGHVWAVLIAHRLATGGFPSRVQALRAELPLTLLMVAYTLAGLAILTSAGGSAA